MPNRLEKGQTKEDYIENAEKIIEGVGLFAQAVIKTVFIGIPVVMWQILTESSRKYSQKEHMKRVARDEEAVRLYNEGMSTSEIYEKLDIKADPEDLKHPSRYDY